MVRLILEENGKRRAFRVGDGVLKLGSGSEAALKLESEGVAAEHLELEVVGDRAKVRVAPGATPPVIDGEQVLGEVELRQGQGLTLGDALVWLEDESLEAGAGRPGPGGAASHGSPQAPRPAARRSSAGKGRGATSSAKREASRQRAMEAARSRPSRSKVQRTRPRAQRGLPSGAIVGIVLAVVVVSGFLLRKGFRVSAEGVVEPKAMLGRAGNAIEEASYAEASRLLAQLPSDKLSRAQRDLVTSYEEQIEEGYEAQRKAEYYRLSHKWFERRLKRYERNWLQGDPSPARIRLFMKRAREFRERWPEYEGMDWVTRQEERFRGAVDLSDPPTFDDIDWEIAFILEGTPRRYEPALDMLDEYLARTDTPEFDREAAQVLRQEIEQERPEQFSEAFKWFEHELEVKGNEQKAVQWLVFAAAFMGDDELENQAARRLIEDIEDLEGHMRAYQRERTDIFDALVENRLMREKAEEFGLL